MSKKYYVGPQKWSKGIRRILSVGEFNIPAKNHDINYSPDTIYTQKEADDIFLKEMLDAVNKHPSPGKRIWLKALAYVYYLMVVYFGKNAYEGKL